MSSCNVWHLIDMGNDPSTSYVVGELQDDDGRTRRTLVAIEPVIESAENRQRREQRDGRIVSALGSIADCAFTDAGPAGYTLAASIDDLLDQLDSIDRADCKRVLLERWS